MSEQAAILSGWLYVPLRVIGGRAEVVSLQERLTHVPRHAEEDDPPVRLYSTERAGYIGVPRAFGLHYFKGLAIDDQTTIGRPIHGIYRRPDPNHPSVRDPAAQAKFMSDLEAAARAHHTFLATAPTGSGKTVSSLDMALALGRKTLVLVHLERLMMQWVEEAIMPILGVPRERIGIVQGARCEYRDKDFVVGMLHSMNLRDYPSAFYQEFGTVIFDEVHKVGSRFFAPTAPMFNARYKVGLSATPTRRDGGDKVFLWHLGPMRVVSTAEAMPMDVYVLKHSNRDYRPPGKFSTEDGVVAKALSLDPKRNELITRMVARLYNSGRQALIVSNSVRHVQRLMQMAEAAGVPRHAMGQFTAELHIREIVDTPQGPKARIKKRKQKASALSYVKENAQLIFATYGMMTEGIDIPRLDAGIDATPRGSATQLVGRIRRPRPGKKKPVWVTILDTDCPWAKRKYKSRCRDYRNSNATIAKAA